MHGKSLSFYTFSRPVKIGPNESNHHVMSNTDKLLQISQIDKLVKLSQIHQQVQMGAIVKPVLMLRNRSK